MRVRATTAQVIRLGEFSSLVLNEGDELEADEALALSLLQTGRVERVATVPETAVLPKRGEQAVRQARPVR